MKNILSLFIFIALSLTTLAQTGGGISINLGTNDLFTSTGRVFGITDIANTFTLSSRSKTLENPFAAPHSITYRATQTTGGATTQRIRFDHPNSLLVNTSFVSWEHLVTNATAGSEEARVDLQISEAGVLPAFSFRFNGDGELIVINGAVLTSGGVWTDASRRDSKEQFEPLAYGMSTIYKLQPLRYTLKATGQKDIGFVAEDVKEVIPELVHEHEGKATLAYSHLTAVIVNALKEMHEGYKELEAQNNELRARIEAIEAKLQ